LNNVQLKTTPVIEEMSKLNFSGNVIPQNWFNFIKFPSGKPDLLGIMLLSEIIYWYRPTEIRDEVTGQIIGYKKKFKADKLQRNYQSFADQFGVSKRQVQDAARRLKEAGLITIELRIITSDTGMILSNVPFFEPVIPGIKQITYPHLQQGGSCNQLHEGMKPNVRGSCNQLHEVMQPNVIGHVTNYMTYTETTTEITTENNDDGELHPASNKNAPDGAKKNDGENYMCLIPDHDPAKVLAEYDIQFSFKNPGVQTCLEKLKKYTPEQLRTIGRVLKEKETAGKISNAEGLLLKDSGVCDQILNNKFYPNRRKMKKPTEQEYEIFVAPPR